MHEFGVEGEKDITGKMLFSMAALVFSVIRMDSLGGRARLTQRLLLGSWTCVHKLDDKGKNGFTLLPYWGKSAGSLGKLNREQWSSQIGRGNITPLAPLSSVNLDFDI